MDDRRLNKNLCEEYLNDHYERRGGLYEVIICDGPALELQFAQLRYKVFCEEHPEFNQTYNINQTETDEYDDHSINLLLVFKPLQMIVGGVRVIFPDHDKIAHGLACIKHPQSFFHKEFPVDIYHTAEISRLMLSRLRLKIVRQYLAQLDPVFDETNHPNATLCLFRGLYQLAKMSDLTTYCAMLELPLIRISRAAGVPIELYGEPIEHHGKRQPIIIDLIALLGNMEKTSMKNAQLFIDMDLNILSNYSGRS